MKSQIYDQAKYYEIAFSFIDAKKQGDLFEEFIKKYSKRKVKTVLDLGCGTALQLREMAKRGYGAIGLDASAKMLDYLRRELLADGAKIETVKADMNKFSLKQKVDFVYIMMGSISYTKNNKLFLSHLNSVAEYLNSGGLYLIENLTINWADPKFWKPQIWTMRRGKIKVRTTYQPIPKDLLSQTVTQTIKLKVDDNGKRMEFIDKDELKIIAPEELKLLVEKNGKFEFIGFFERYKARPLRKISSDNIALLRRI
ncbi:MAG TPA: class I SAM-dependent methyltransferase [Candidatus Moranbacteria bacterium]|nr:class I SAM-dependent methyltransferase [Candidatus Moranbacteria bacterium]